MRAEFSRKVRRQIIERASGRCEACEATLKPSEGEVDHILPCALGGEPTVANGRLICRVCHVEKSATDIRRIRKADRARDKSTGAIAPKQKIRSAGFPVSRKPERPARATLPPRQLYRQETP
jgi:5-methylcytosine-specific restriction protein A